ncbi:uridine kinase family-domain-containing protein [Suillus paluster]|uniref:uridine kinase family-domain-containing protein n=1 Tax=Suillus paluster TaxID=48578 RepID=UPI001B860E9E|nr:uridine kinase family-domain-containing protein [Suillus paluster]KAG1729668.1 uridine kinase family-domain-containing protein [Suillus paluster]
MSFSVMKYGEDGLPICDAFVVGIAGGSASGKTHVARQIVRSLGSVPTVVILSQDSFYKRHTPEEVALAHANRIDFDHPDAIDMPMFAACLAELKACRQTNIPVYSFAEHQRLDEVKYLYGAAIIITEGIMALHDPELRSLYDLKVFVQCDSDLMLARRIQRDVKERGRNVEGVLEQYLRYVKPAFDHFVLPTARHADIVVPGSNNSVAIDLISTHIRPSQSIDSCLSTSDGSPVSKNLIVLPQTPQLKGMYTVLRDGASNRQDFIFFVDRLATFLIEKAMEHLPYRPKTVTTPTGVDCAGKELDVKNICGVSIIRSYVSMTQPTFKLTRSSRGGPLTRGLQRVLSDVAIGSLLVQSDSKTGEPLLLHVMLPKCLRERHLAVDTWVFLLDAQVSTAASAFMAIRTLLDHGVQQDHIIFVTFLIARTGGLTVLQRAFPKVKIVTGAVDEVLREAWLESYNEKGEGQSEGDGKKVWVVEPGMGHIGDRYYL